MKKMDSAKILLKIEANLLLGGYKSLALHAWPLLVFSGWSGSCLSPRASRLMPFYSASRLTPHAPCLKPSFALCSMLYAFSLDFPPFTLYLHSIIFEPFNLEPSAMNFRF